MVLGQVNMAAFSTSTRRDIILIDCDSNVLLALSCAHRTAVNSKCTPQPLFCAGRVGFRAPDSGLGSKCFGSRKFICRCFELR